jgi:hypothetical protein
MNADTGLDRSRGRKKIARRKILPAAGRRIFFRANLLKVSARRVV